MTVVRGALAPEFVRFPTPIPRELYDRAAREYARLVAGRTRSVYRTGRISVAGISDLDLLVVPTRARYDNYAYFSIDRLPPPLRLPFRHGPFVVPPESPTIRRYSSHRAPVLVSGDEVLRRVPPAAAPEDRWSMLLEDYCHYHRYFEQVRRARRADVRFLLSKLGSIRIPVRLLTELVDTGTGATRGARPARDPELTNLLERGRSIRVGWFGPVPGTNGEMSGRDACRDLAAEAWEVLSRTFDWLDRSLRRALSQPAAVDLVAVAHAFLRGEAVVPGADPAMVRARQEAILAYSRSMRRFGISGFPVVPCLLHHDEVRRSGPPRPPRPVRAIIRFRYGLDRAIRTLRQA